MKDGDRIIIDAETKGITVDITEKEMQVRRQAWKAPPPKVQSGWLWKYSQLVQPANRGCSTDRYSAE